MKNREKLESLARSVDLRISEIQAATTASPYTESILNILRELQSHLAGEDEINFGRYAFSIFRIVTDDFDLEKSDIGQKLLGLSSLLQQFR